MNETRALARFVAETRFADLPPSLVANLRLTVLDTLAAAFVGSVQPWARRILEVARALGGPPDASVIHQDWRTDVSRAAFANGVLIGAFECEPLTGSHASGTVLPAALAICQREHLDGPAFLTALAVGFELSARLARAAVGLETERGFHNPGAQGPFAAAAAAGKLYGLDAERIASALGIAGSSSAGLLEFAWSGGDTKRLHLGRAAQLGLESALLARRGVNGPATVIEGRSGYFTAFSTKRQPETLVDGLGTRWAIEPPSLKSFATHVTQQAVVAAIQGLKREHPLDPKSITRVVIRGAHRIMEARHTGRAPHDVLGGQYSLPFTTAVALTRDMSNPLVYDEDAVRDPLVRDLARRIELEPVDDAGHDTPGFWPAEIHLECAGQRHTVRTRPHKGSPGNPFTWDEVSEKFRRYTASMLDASRASAVIERVRALEQLGNMAELARLLARA
jgi:2-methylcitrate dehydratase PrpD